MKVSHVINPISRSWDREKLKHCTSNEQVHEVCNIPISLFGPKDKLTWKDTKSCNQVRVCAPYIHSVKGISLLLVRPSSSMWKKFWSIPTLPKIRMFMWKVLRNWVACLANLVKRKCGSNSLCPICESLSETMEHLLFHCPWSRAVWFGSNKAFCVFHMEVVAVDRWMKDLICGDLAKETS